VRPTRPIYDDRDDIHTYIYIRSWNANVGQTRCPPPSSTLPSTPQPTTWTVYSVPHFSVFSPHWHTALPIHIRVDHRRYITRLYYDVHASIAVPVVPVQMTQVAYNREIGSPLRWTSSISGPAVNSLIAAAFDLKLWPEFLVEYRV